MSRLWRIGVVADTHDRVPDGVIDLLSGVDEVWHLGDVCEPPVLDRFLVLGVPLHVVRGNNDWTGEWPLTLDLERGGVRFHLVHIPPVRDARGDVVLHGHTHVPRDETVRGIRHLNPGAVSRANKGAPPSLALMDVGEGRITWRIVLLDRGSGPQGD